MTTQAVTAILRGQACRASRHIPGIAWYLFGSALVDAESAADIDVLIVYASEADRVAIRQHLSQCCLPLPVHLILMSREEQDELDFVAAQGCRRIFP